MWMKMIAFGATTSILALSACASSGDENVENADIAAVENDSGEAPLAVEEQFCGGFAGIACPKGYTCEDDPNDGCNPATGGADCGGICVRETSDSNARDCSRLDPTQRYASRSPDQCAAMLFRCDDGERVFFNECGCGCEPVLETCGSSTCGVGEFCCNASCSICAPEGGACIQIVCE
jgi:hypothetical protein